MWNCVVQETEKIVQRVRENADALCAKTLESVVHLINEKKASKKLYMEERQRIDNEFTKVTYFLFFNIFQAVNFLNMILMKETVVLYTMI